MPLSSAPILAVATIALATPAAASAQLGLPLPAPVQTVTDTTGQVTDTVTGALPDPLGGVVDTVTGDAGGVVNTVTGATGGITDTVGQTVDQVLGGTLGQLPVGTIDDLLGSAGLNGLIGPPGAPGSPGVTVLPDGTVLVDSRPPVTSVKILNTTRQVGRYGRLSLRITSDEPSVIALSGSIRPGIARNRKIARHHSRKPVKFPSVVLAYRKAGALKLTIQFSRKAQRNLRHGYNARLTLSMLAVDVARNQQKRLVKRIVKH